MAGDSFQEAAEGRQNWAVRLGAEPVDMHFFGRKSWWDEFAEDTLGITAGLGSYANHQYIEFGTVGEDGEFTTLKRVHGFSIDEADGELILGKALFGRAFVMVVDGELTPFSMDPIYQDDPHATKPNQLQHADSIWTNSNERHYWSNDPKNDATRIVYKGSERVVLQLYATVISKTMELNNRDLPFGIFGNGTPFLGGASPNAISFKAELEEALHQVAQHLGVEILPHEPVGWNPGENDVLETGDARVATWDSLQDLRGHVSDLEKAASEQLQTLFQKGNDVDLQTPIPQPPGGASP